MTAWTGVVLLGLLAGPADEAGTAGRSMTLVVRDEAGPIAGARARAAGGGDAVAADGEGRIRLSADEGEAAACVVAPGHRWTRVEWAEEASPPVVVRLASGASARGRVLDELGRPVRGARVVAESAQLGACAPATVTDAAGAFVLAGLAPGAATLVARAPGHLDRRFEGIRVGAPRPVELHLRRAVAVSGSVADAAGAPIAGARIRVLPDWPRARLEPPLRPAEKTRIDALEARTDDEGRFDLGPLPRRDAWRLAVTSPEHAPQAPVLDGTGPQATVAVRLRPGATLALRAVDLDGRPWAAPRAVVRWRRPEPGQLVDMPAMGDAEGRVVAAHLPATGRAVVEISAPGAQPASVRGVALTDGKTTALGDVVLLPGATLSGRVRSTEGAPLPEAKVTAKAWVGGRKETLEVTADRDGVFVIDGLDPTGDVALRAEADGHVPASRTALPADSRDVMLELAPAGALRLFVSDARTGEPVTGATVEMRTAGTRSVFRPVEPSDDDDADQLPGELLLDPLTAGRRAVRVRAPGLAPGILEDVEIVAGRVVERDVVLEPGWDLTGSVVDAQGRGVAGALVSAILPGGGAQSARSELDGAFALGGLEGTVSLVVEHREWRTARVEALDAPAAAGGLEVVLQRGGTVEGFVLSGDGAPIAGAQVKVEGQQREALSAGDGGYRLSGLEPGRLRLMKVDVAGSHRGFEEAVLEVNLDEVVRHDFGAGLRVSGRVTLGREPVEGAAVSFTPVVLGEGATFDAMVGRHAVSDIDGEYVAAGVRPGLNVVTVTWRDRRSGRDVEIPDVPDHRLDVEIPDLTVSGVVVRADDGRPVPLAVVTARPTTESEGGAPDRPGMSRSMGGSGDEPRVYFSTRPEASATTDSAGRFVLLLPEPGRWLVTAFAWRDDQLETEEPVALDVRHPIEQVVIEVAGDDGSTGDLVVRILDAETGAVVPTGSVMTAYEGSTSINSFTQGEARSTELPAGPVDVVAWTPGRAPLWRQVEIVPGETTEAELPLEQGGALRVFVPEDAAVSLHHFWGLRGLALVGPDGADLAARLGPAIGAGATPDGLGAWLLKDLPVGPLRVELPDGASADVDVERGLTVEADLR